MKRMLALCLALMVAVAMTAGAEEAKTAKDAKPTKAAPVAAKATTKDKAMESVEKQVAAAAVDKSKSNWRLTLTKPAVVEFDPGHNYYARMLTNKGTILIRFMPEVAPMHVTSFMYLTKLGFYDGIRFHRVISDFMAQGGCPIGNGTGSPGYQFDGEYSPKVKHDKPGLLSMANAGPGTDGSQFFLTFKATPWLDGKHTIFGEIVEGMDVMKVLEAAGSPNGATKEPLLMEKVTIEVKPKKS